MKFIVSALLLSSIFTLGFSSHAEAKPKSEAYPKAKQECLAEKPDLKGKMLQKCIKEKSGK